jgi:hypothetical protein
MVDNGWGFSIRLRGRAGLIVEMDDEQLTMAGEKEGSCDQ